MVFLPHDRSQAGMARSGAIDWRNFGFCLLVHMVSPQMRIACTMKHKLDLSC
jgi:hypothetical protein